MLMVDSSGFYSFKSWRLFTDFKIFVSEVVSEAPWIERVHEAPQQRGCRHMMRLHVHDAR